MSGAPWLEDGTAPGRTLALQKADAEDRAERVSRAGREVVREHQGPPTAVCPCGTTYRGPLIGDGQWRCMPCTLKWASEQHAESCDRAAYDERRRLNLEEATRLAVAEAEAQALRKAERETQALLEAACVVCGEPTPCVRRLPAPTRVCGGCYDALERREPWWLRLLRWAVR